MKLKDVISRVDGMKPNAFSHEVKTGWVNELENMVQTEIFLLAPEEMVEYTWEANAESELLIKAPYSKLYWIYLSAMIDFTHGEYDKYSQTMQMFNAWLQEYQIWYARAFRPADGGAVRMGYYLSAYGLAKLHGFEGTEEDWLESLVGPKGAPFTYEDFTAEQLEALRGPQGETLVSLERTEGDGSPGTVDTYTVTSNTGKTWSLQVRNGPVGPRGPEGADFTYDDFTEEQLAALKGRPFTYEDFTPAQLEALRGPAGETITDISRTSGTGAPGTVDTYTVTTSTGRTWPLYMYNGKDGGVNIPGGAEVGQIIQVAEVDETGKPTAWNTSNPIAVSAELDESRVAHFKNSLGVVLFSLDLSEVGVPLELGDLVVSAESLSIAEGGSGTFTVKLASAPNVKQTVYLALSDNTKLSVSPASLVFTPDNWETEQTVTLTAAQDEDMKNDTITVNLTSKNVDGKSLVVSVTDDDIPVLVEDGLAFYVNLRNMADQNSAATAIVDSVGGVTCTAINIAFDDTSGFLDNNGLTMPTTSTALQFSYPLKTANIPNGFTYELSMKGMGCLYAAGSGFTNGGWSGYAYRAAMYKREGDTYFWISPNFAIMNTDGTTSATNSTNDVSVDLVDLTQENVVTIVSEIDGSANVYWNGKLLWTSEPLDTFERYNISGNITFRIPYGSDGVSQEINLASVKLYERALTAEEVKQNANYEISKRSVSDF